MKKLISLFAVFTILVTTLYSQNGWVQLTDYPGNGRAGAVGFRFQFQGLVGMGYAGGNNLNSFNDFWAYTPSTNAWQVKANCPALTRYSNCSFSIGKYGFITMGCNGSSGYTYLNDLWQYDESSNSWTQKAYFPGGGRYGAVAFGTATKAYAGLGERDNSLGIQDYYTDFYEYDQAANSWTQKASFPGQGRYGAFSFFVNGLFYVVGGRTEDLSYNWIYLKDMWAYDPANNTWSQKASYPGSGSWIYGFVINNCGYAGTGFDGSSNFNDFWRYNPVNDTWIQLANFPGSARRCSFYFSVGNTGYLGCGGDGYSEFNDFWKYNDPAFSSIENSHMENIDIRVFPTPAQEIIYIESPGINKVQIINCNGKLCGEMTFNKDSKLNSILLNGFPVGIYFLIINSDKGEVTKKIVKINN